MAYSPYQRSQANGAMRDRADKRAAKMMRETQGRINSNRSDSGRGSSGGDALAGLLLLGLGWLVVILKNLWRFLKELHEGGKSKWRKDTK